MSSYKLKIGLDYHGVIDKNTNYFSGLCKCARKRGHSIYIITGGPISTVKSQLKYADIQYDFIFAISDYYFALDKIEQLPNGSLNVPPHLWNIAKAEFCRRNHINLHIDDGENYLHWFSTPFCLYNNDDNVCYLSPGVKIKFDYPYDKVLDEIERIVFNLNSVC